MMFKSMHVELLYVIKLIKLALVLAQLIILYSFFINYTFKYYFILILNI